MALANENYVKAPEIYNLDTVEKQVNAFKVLHPNAKILRLGVGDVTRPLPQEVVKAMHIAIDEMSDVTTFRGYAPPQGYDFLIEKILKEYKTQGISFDKESIFINDGAKPDIGNIGHVLGRDNIVAIAEPVYPVYENATIMSGRAGIANVQGEWTNIVYLRCTAKTDFVPQLPTERVDVIYLCNPNNPTGTVLNKDALKRWVDYAMEHQSIIVYDGAYRAYITQSDVPRSIYEIKGAKKVAIEIRTYSKTAGFTGLRCGYSVFPQELMVYTKTGDSVPLVTLWGRRKANYTNGVSYIIQRAAEAIYTPKGQSEVQTLVQYYLNNALMIRKTLIDAGYEVYGGINAPYIWFRASKNLTSWKLFRQFLYENQVVGTPGILFGASGEGYMRFTGFSSKEDTIEALDRIKKCKIF